MNDVVPRIARLGEAGDPGAGARVHVASGANVTNGPATAANKKPRHSVEPGVFWLLKMAWR